MVSNVYYGEISPQWKQKWGQIKSADPYDVLSSRTEIFIGGWDFLDCASKYFRLKVQVDWGSYAYKCTKQELEAFSRDKQIQIEGIEDLDLGTEYGIVFIEGV